jgi:branched-chain amino acid transport system ATP-binding protein
MTTPLLHIDRVSIHFGGLAALSGVSLTVGQGEILGLIGPNGAGKTTLFNLITGLLRPSDGRIVFRGIDITLWPSHAICRLGIARTFQLIRTFPGLSVLENVLVGLYFGRDGEALPKAQAQAEAMDLLRFVGLHASGERPAGSLPLADRKRLEVARALATRPALLLLDEAIAGLTPTEGKDLMNLIGRIRDGGTTIIMIEHIMKAIMHLSDRIVVLHHGEKLAEGTPREIVQDETVVNAYLGEQAPDTP